jgi:hypothetical protein
VPPNPNYFHQQYDKVTVGFSQVKLFTAEETGSPQTAKEFV